MYWLQELPNDRLLPWGPVDSLRLGAQACNGGLEPQTFERFETTITGLCTDMSVSLQVAPARLSPAW